MIPRSMVLQKPWPEIAASLSSMGLEPGWGANVGLVKESMHDLLEILQAPDDQTVARFLGRLPMINDVIPFGPFTFFNPPSWSFRVGPTLTSMP